jgi:DNA-binding CsgD family transcriptional regulator
VTTDRDSPLHDLERWAAAALQAQGSVLESLTDEVLPALRADRLAAALAPGQRVDLAVVGDEELPALVDGLGGQDRGELLWMRPDQWSDGVGGDIDAWVGEQLAAGRRSRALYPARVLEAAPRILWERAEAGERVRILAEVPCRMAVLGGAAALLSEEYGVATDRRVVVRHPSVVATLRLSFETLWEKAMAVPGLDAPRRPQDVLARGVLLDLLADGAKDEQISRELGVSLRTVRRRVADLLEELGSSSRFQAGVEAVRRGWV